MYVNPTTRQTLEYATPIPFEINPENVVAPNQILCIDPKTYQKVPLQIFESKLSETAINPDIYSSGSWYILTRGT